MNRQLSEQLFRRLEHGTAEHRQWLKEQLDQFFSNLVPPKLQLAAKDYFSTMSDGTTYREDVENAFIAGAQWETQSREQEARPSALESFKRRIGFKKKEKA